MRKIESKKSRLTPLTNLTPFLIVELRNHLGRFRKEYPRAIQIKTRFRFRNGDNFTPFEVIEEPRGTFKLYHIAKFSSDYMKEKDTKVLISIFTEADLLNAYKEMMKVM